MDLFGGTGRRPSGAVATAGVTVYLRRMAGHGPDMRS
jgi:hypothetical protein